MTEFDANGSAGDAAQERPAQERPTQGRLARVILDGMAHGNLSPVQEADRQQAVADLEADNLFLPEVAALRGPRSGPFLLHLSVQEGRLVLDVRDADDAPMTVFALALGPFRRLLKDYQLLVDSHIKAVEEGREARIQAIDMGRRGLHNEGAELLMLRLHGKVAIDQETARRLFTLLCVLHQRI